MVIVSIINSILQAMVDDENCALQSWQYNDLSTSNVRLDNKKPSPTAVFLQIADWTIGYNAINVREESDINISFLEKEGKLDAGGLEQDQIIDRMKILALDFIQRLRNVKSLEIDDDEVKVKSVFLRSDSNRSGVNIQMKVRERQGECINSGEYNPVLNIGTNGVYNVGGYTQVVVNIECPEPPAPPVPDYLCFTAEEPGVKITMVHKGTNQTTTMPQIWWSKDNELYNIWNFGEITLPNIGDKVYFYGDNPNGVGRGDNDYSYFVLSGSVAASGDATSLISQYGVDVITASYALTKLFYNCASLTTAPELPATTLAPHCYEYMFWNCTALTTAPATLPATTLAPYCYVRMFQNCTSLTTAPATLPATTLESSCYTYMFFNCTSLTTAPALPATTLAPYCYEYMFRDCISLTTSPATLPATTLTNYCYYGMFAGCTSLTTAPELPATTLEYFCYAYMFRDCTSLTTAPALPATTLANDCYVSMFNGCTSLTTAPALPATTLASRCYDSMFRNCTELTTAPELPATTLTGSCYYQMFGGCTSLTSAPALPATTLANYCYSAMFYGCTSLTTPPVLPATTLADYCYEMMFRNCTELTTAPELPATTLETSCYEYMFQGCTSLTKAPELPATTLENYCYTYMFRGCSSLNYIKVGVTDWNTSKTYIWVENVAPTGTFYKTSALTNIPIDDNSGVPIGWTVVNYDDPPVPPTPPTPTEPDYVSITAVQAGATIGMVNNNNSPVIYCSTDQTNWTQWDYSDITLVNIGDKVYFYGDNPNGVSGAINSSSFAITGNVAVSGDITTLISREGTDTVPAYCFNALFQNCDITSAPALPATTLGDGCYISMFRNCTELTTAPELPATTLATNCYWGMFNGCTSLTTAPSLPATTLADGCYCGMFGLCTSLTMAPALPTTTLVQNCYSAMFNGCSSLQNVACLATDVSATDCTWEWLNGVSLSGTFTKAAGMNDWTTGTSGIPSGWTVINYSE